MPAALVAALATFFTKLLNFALRLILVIGLLTVISPILPTDPLQGHIMQWATTIRAHISMLYFFVPVRFCFFAFAFAVAYKYMIKPLRIFLRSAEFEDYFKM